MHRPPPFLFARLFLAVVCGGVAACGEGPDPGGGATLPDAVPVHTLDPAAALLRLGDEADASGGFGRIEGAVLLGGELLVVADGSLPALLYFATDGSLRTRAGAGGQGPGEFRFLSWIQRDPEGRGIWAYDQGNARASLFSADGALLDEIGTPSVGALTLPHIAGVLADDGLLLRGNPADAPSRDPQPGRQRFDARVVVADRSGGSIRPLWEGVASEWGAAVTGTAARPRIIQGPMPLAGELALCVGGSGQVVVAPHTAARLHVAEGPAWTPTVIEWSEPDRPVDAVVFRNAVRELLDQMGAGGLPPAVEETYLALDPPAALPVNEGVLCAGDGSLWVGRYPEPGALTKEWRVLDSRGVRIGTVSSPRNLRPVWVGEDRLLAVEEDDLGVERVLLLDYPGGLWSVAAAPP